MSFAAMRRILCDFRHFGVAFLVGACALASAPQAGFAQQQLSWAEQMFKEHKHDFGDVAKGAVVAYRVPFTNLYKQPVHVATVTSSCGCTSAKVSQNTVQPNETTFLEITLDTLNHQRKKEAKITITIDQPQAAVVIIPVTAYIRPDVVIQPGSVNFGAIELGAGGTRKATINYAGRPDWKIADFRPTSPDLNVSLIETKRDGVSLVSYELEVALKPGVPAGTFRSQVLLTPNDVNAQPIPVLVEARVESDITITPDVQPLGTLSPGATKSFVVVVKGKKPFTIDKLECDNGGNDFKVRLPQGEKQVHTVPLTFTAPKTPGAVNEVFTLTIAGRSQPVTFRAYGTVGPN